MREGRDLYLHLRRAVQTEAVGIEREELTALLDITDKLETALRYYQDQKNYDEFVLNGAGETVQQRPFVLADRGFTAWWHLNQYYHGNKEEIYYRGNQGEAQ